MYGKNYTQTASDIHFSVGDAGVRLLFGCVLLIGLIGYGAYLFDGQSVAKSASWPTVDGKLITIDNRPVGIAVIGRFLPIVCPYAKYSYKVDNREYTREVTAGPCISFVRGFTFHPPEVLPVKTDDLLERMEKARADAVAGGKPRANFLEQMEADMELMSQDRYKPVSIRYERTNPENSVMDPAVLQSDKSLLYSSLLLVTLGGLLLGGSYYNSYLSKLSAEDPTLSLETALAAQRRRR
ncbi:MAG TPA: hypothetical protein PKN86_01305 [Candidatus Obscuribacter sp.]|nr:hypothetical protein [Candidatus Obscuribacter sp.]HMY52950.1 hypothetical protein [Candidatus Obscuribacter sp.]HNB14806.1 hypothetical protein [Candidatus Obscuribacter sp.]HND04466.1 hypothetical protein [Candidatus Obscuribacter sp.]HNG17579.1 hypothetical protein [Candidatus Obscuribacter sp.]